MSQLERVTVALPDLNTVDFEVADKTDHPSVFVLGVRKSGSSVFNTITAALGRANDCHYVDVAGIFFARDIVVAKWRRDPMVLAILKPGNVYGGFRALPTAIAGHRMFRQSRRALLVRDPRDALVSEYFSNAYSHSLPTTELAKAGAGEKMLAMRQETLHAEIDDIVVKRAPEMNRTMIEYQEVAADPLTLVLKYEDVILDKRRLILSVATHFSWSCPAPVMTGILEWADKVPSTEVPTAFIRKVVPGDHRNKLKPETITQLDQLLAPAMSAFGYAA